jgi:hypothetical protein
MTVFKREQGPEGTKLGISVIPLNVAITGVALVLALIAAQSPFF